MVDQIRVLAKLDELEQYLKELRSIVPADMAQYQKVSIKRACERLLQLCIECTIDVCKWITI